MTYYTKKMSLSKEEINTINTCLYAYIQSDGLLVVDENSDIGCRLLNLKDSSRAVEISNVELERLLNGLNYIDNKGVFTKSFRDKARKLANRFRADMYLFGDSDGD